MKDVKDKKISKSQDNNKKKLRIGKIVIKDTKKFCISVGAFIICIVLICVLISNLADRKIDDSTDLSSVNASKHQQELLAKYEQSSMKELFLEDYDKIQNSVGLYIINNSTMEDDSINKLTKELNSILSKEDWEQELEIVCPDTWNGKWSVDSDGILKFKFSNKNIEPSWTNDEDIILKVVKN